MATKRFFTHANYKWALAGVVLVVACWVIYPCWWRPMVTAVVIRHAEKGPGTDPPLIGAGEDRAQELVRVLGSVPFSRIYVTEYVRTLQTATPLAEHLAIEPIERAMSASATVVHEIESGDAGPTALVVGHTSTVRHIVEELSNVGISPIPEAVYDNMFIVTLCRCRWSGRRLLHLKYGVPTT